MKIKSNQVQQMIAEGYCRISRKHMIIARIDRKDWRLHLARTYFPWDVMGHGMHWANSSSMDDFYRRCESKDEITLHPDCKMEFMMFPPSADAGPASDFLPKQVPEVRGKPAVLEEPSRITAGTSESQPDQQDDFASHRPEVSEVFLWIAAAVAAVWVATEIIRR